MNPTPAWSFVVRGRDGQAITRYGKLCWVGHGSTKELAKQDAIHRAALHSGVPVGDLVASGTGMAENIAAENIELGGNVLDDDD